MTKKPVYKQPLFWTTIGFGFLSIVLFVFLFRITSNFIEVENALAKHNVYYDSKDKDISTSSKSEEKFQADLLDEYSWMKAFAAIKKGETVSWSDMIIVKTQYTFQLDKMLQLTEKPTEEQKRAVENGKDIMDQTVNFYKNAEHYDRELSKEEKSIILSNISEMMKVVYLFTKEH